MTYEIRPATLRDLADIYDIELAQFPEPWTKSMLKDEITSVLQTLDERERKILELRFGIHDGTSRTLEEVGAEFSVTRERVRQIESKALRKLRHPTRSRRIKSFLDMAAKEAEAII